MQAVGNRTTSLPTQAIVNGLAIFGALSAAAILMAAVVIGSGALSLSLRGSSTALTAADPLGAPATVAFRASERAEAPAYVGDPLGAPWVIQFRNSEHAAAAKPWTGDPLSQPSLVQFRNSEHGSAAQTSTDPLRAPSVVQFRNSEHSEAP